MDDSEKSYGYSKDIYHGRRGVGGHYDPEHADESYETEGEGDPATEGEPSQEEAAVHVVDREKPKTESPETPETPVNASDLGGRNSSNRVESFTWDIAGSTAAKK